MVWLESDNDQNCLISGPFLLKWMPEVISAGYICDFLSLLINVIKFNAAYLYEEEVAGLVQ